jgi:hypothetical protein
LEAEGFEDAVLKEGLEKADLVENALSRPKGRPAWRRTSLIGGRVLAPRPPATPPPAALLVPRPLAPGRVLRPRPLPKKRPRPSAAAPGRVLTPRPPATPPPAAPLVPHPPAGSPPAAILWAAWVAALPAEEVTWAALQEVPVAKASRRNGGKARVSDPTRSDEGSFEH